MGIHELIEKDDITIIHVSYYDTCTNRHGRGADGQ